MNDKKKLRKKTFVSKVIQGRVLTRLTIYWCLYHVVLWHAMFLYRYWQYKVALLGGAQPVPFNELYGTFVAQHHSLVLCAVLVFPIIFWDMLRITHRVAGPLVRFQNSLRRLASGERVEKIRLRRNDLLVEFQDAFNEYLESLDQRQTEKPSASVVADQVDSDQSESDEPQEQLLEDLREIQETLEQAKVDSNTPPAVEGTTESQKC